MDMEEGVTFITENGDEIECCVLLTFKSDETKKNYIVYTDGSFNEDEEMAVFASIYIPDEEGGISLLPIETEDEWNLVEFEIEKWRFGKLLGL